MHACALVRETHDLDHPEACGLVNVSSDSYPIRTVTIGKYYFIIKLKLENKFFNLRGIHRQSFDEVSLLLMEEMR